jgi:hypothetical protein
LYVRVKGWRFNGGMPALTRRRSKDASEECWHVYYGDVRVGTIAIRSSNPFATDPWQWRCGFYPGSLPGDCTSGTAASFGEARDAFELAWRVFLANRTEADFDEYRKHRRLDSLEIRDVGFGMQAAHPIRKRPVHMLLRAVIDIKGLSQHVHLAHMEAA